MKKITVLISGMHCAACAQKIESSVKKINGVKYSNVNIATERATIEFNEKVTSERKITNVIKGLGYGVIKENLVDKEREHREKEIWNLKKLFIASVILTVPIFVISMPLMWLGITIPYESLILLLLATCPVHSRFQVLQGSVLGPEGKDYQHGHSRCLGNERRLFLQPCCHRLTFSWR